MYGGQKTDAWRSTEGRTRVVGPNVDVGRYAAIAELGIRIRRRALQRASSPVATDTSNFVKHGDLHVDLQLKMAPPGRTTAQNGSSFAPGNAPAASSSKTTSLSKSQQGSSSANGIGIHGHAAGDIADGRGQGRDETVEVLYLQPSAYPRNGKGKWKDTGRSLAVTISPINGEVVAYVTPQVSFPFQKETNTDQSSPVAMRTPLRSRWQDHTSPTKRSTSPRCTICPTPSSHYTPGRTPSSPRCSASLLRLISCPPPGIRLKRTSCSAHQKQRPSRI